MRKVLALILSMVMALTMTSTAFAYDGVSGASVISDYYVDDIFVAEHEDATLSLHVISDYDVTIDSCEWSIYNEELDEDITLGEGTSFTVKDFNKTDYEYYDCNAVISYNGDTEEIHTTGHIRLLNEKKAAQEGQQSSIYVDGNGISGITFTPEKTGMYKIATIDAADGTNPEVFICIGGDYFYSSSIDQSAEGGTTELSNSNDVELKIMLEAGKTYVFALTTAKEAAIDFELTYLADEKCSHASTYKKHIAPTCTSEGKKDIEICKQCGETVSEGEVIPMKEHTEGEHIVKAAGYLVNGTDYYVCSVCGSKYDIVNTPGWSKSYVKGFKLSKAKKRFTAKWKRQSKANQKKFTGYRIRYSTKANMSGAKTVYVGKTKRSKRIKGLVSKKRYYVELSTYVKNANGTFYSKPVTKTVVVK